MNSFYMLLKMAVMEECFAADTASESFHISVNTDHMFDKF